MTTMVNVGDLVAGKYRVEKILGVGGMGMVVAALHLELDQRVALKMMLPEVMHAPQHVERFLREARAAVRLRNEHVCRVLDVGKQPDGSPYIVMELMEGRDLGDVLTSSAPLPVIDAVDYMLQALEGIAEAHANQIVHRDLKPGNLFVTTHSDGSPLVKVLDFGISKWSAAGKATKTGDVMGTPSYMAPEQMMSSKDVDGRADVWALGVILYEALTARLPFENESLPALCMSVIHDHPAPPSAHRADLPPALTALVMSCLSKPVEHRVPNVGALATGLAPFGRADATMRAERINKMLARASSSVVTPSHNAFASTVIGSSPSLPSPQAPGLRVSTLQSSASEVQASATMTTSGGRRALVLGIGTALVLVAVGIGVGLSARKSEPTAQPVRAMDQPAPEPPTPTPTVVAPPAVAPPAVAPAAPVEVVEEAKAPPSPPTTVTAPQPKEAPPTPPRRSTTAPVRTVVKSPGKGSAAAVPATGSATVPETTQPYDPLSRRTRE